MKTPRILLVVGHCEIETFDCKDCGIPTLGYSLWKIVENIVNILIKVAVFFLLITMEISLDFSYLNPLFYKHEPRRFLPNHCN